jgi:maltose phosphorylase
MRIVDNQLHFNTRIPDNWESYTFKINFRDQIVKVTVSHEGANFELTGTASITLFNHGELFNLEPKSNVYA